MNIFYPVSGGNEIGASCYFFHLGDSKIIVDMGKRYFGKKVYPDFLTLINKGFIDGLWEIDAVFISHVHLDHIGGLINYIDELVNANIYISAESFELYKVVLYCNLKKTDEKLESFFMEKINKIMEKTVLLYYGEKYNIKDLQVTCFKAGHILGASSILIEYKDRKILYTGDFTDYDLEAVKAQQLPKSLEVDILISESTYGYFENKINRKSDELNFIRRVKNIIDNGGNILVPTFALGKSQEIALILKKYLNNGILPNNMHVVLDGLCITYSLIYQKSGITIFNDNINIAKSNFHKKINNLSRTIVITSSANMAPYSRSYYYYKEMMDDSKNKLFLSYYRDEEYVKEKYINKFKRNQNTYFYRIATHADVIGIKNLIEKTQPKKVIFVHGDFSSKNRNNIYSLFINFFKDIEFILSLNNKEYYF
jgi:Cft2 family RNA processing exonuclease